MILVVGATGLLGREICRLLAAQAIPFSAMIRTTSDPEKVADLQKLGAHLITADLKQPSTLAAACQGISKIISTASCTFSAQENDNIATVDHQGQLNLVEAAKNAGVEKFVFISFRNDPNNQYPLTEAKRAVEAALFESSMDWCSLQAGYFMEIWLSPALGFDYPNGQVQVYGDGESKISFISYLDVAKFAVEALDNPYTTNKNLEIGGPEKLSPKQVIGVFEAIAGKAFTVNFVPHSDLEAQKAQAPDPLQQSFAGLMLQYALGDSIEMNEVLKHLPIDLTSVEQYAQGLYNLKNQNTMTSSTTEFYPLQARGAELEAIKQVINLYESGVRNGDLNTLKEAFHPKSSMFGNFGKDLYVTPIEGLYQYVSTTTPPAKEETTNQAFKCTITAIALAGKSASVEVAMDFYHGAQWTDFFQLLKVEGRWWIVSKLFHADPIEVK